MEQDYAPVPPRQIFPGPIVRQQVSPVSRKRPLYHLEKTSTPQPIYPGPSTISERFPVPGMHTPIQMSPTTVGTPNIPPRKRGRPTKAEIERRTRIAQARGEQYPSPKKTTPRKVTITEPGPVAPVDERVTLPAETLP